MRRPLEGIIDYSYPPGHRLRYPRFGLGDADLYPGGSQDYVNVHEVATVLLELIKEVERLQVFVESCLPAASAAEGTVDA